jgi:predicted transcriptional regulator
MRLLDPRQMLTLRVLGALHTQERATTRDISNALEAAYDKVGVTMRRLLNVGMVERTSTNPFDWWLTGSGEAYRSALLELLGNREDAA